MSHRGCRRFGTKDYTSKIERLLNLVSFDFYWDKRIFHKVGIPRYVESRGDVQRDGRGGDLDIDIDKGVT